MEKVYTQVSHKIAVKNIKAMFKASSQTQIDAGMAWYQNAQDQAQAIAIKHDMPVYIVVAVIAALSPNNKWARNLQNADDLIAGFIAGDAIETIKVSTYHKMKQKAWAILQDIPDYDMAKTMLNGQKITSFFMDIMGEFNVTIDGHARNIAYNERVGLTDDRTNIGVREYRALQEAYYDAARDLDLMPYQLQAITWTAWRELHGIVQAMDIQNISPNRLVPYYLMSSYLYYHANAQVLTDADYDQICKRLLFEWDNISHPHKGLVTRADLEAGTGYAIKYTNMIKGAAMAWLAENK